MPTHKHNFAHKQAQKAHPILIHCEICSSAEKLVRHHPDYSKPTEIMVVCSRCHIKIHQEDGTYKAKKEKNCVICGKPFLPSHSKKHKTCSPECLKEIGRRNAVKRWENHSRSKLCEWCKIEFEYKNPKVKTCSKECSYKLGQSKHKY